MKTHTRSSAHLMSKSLNKELNPQFMSWRFSKKKKIEVKQAIPLRCAQVPRFCKLFLTSTAADMFGDTKYTFGTKLY